MSGDELHQKIQKELVTKNQRLWTALKWALDNAPTFSDQTTAKEQAEWKEATIRIANGVKP